ncbi:MAG: 4-hydroxythreonine-4-phosphate dehydrogenase PdxA [Planktomarina sp.]
MSIAPIALTCGDPAGIGPEICGKAWNALRQDVPMVYFGDPAHLSPDIPKQNWMPDDDVSADALSVCPIYFAPDLKIGETSLPHAAGTIAAIEQAVAKTRTNQMSAICTAPINKKVLQDGAGFEFPGHTEFLAHLAGKRDVVMMLASPMLRVVPATIHIPLSEVPTALTHDNLLSTFHITATALKNDFGITSPRIAIAGLDPHAGENGNIGTLDRDLVAPAVAAFKAEGWDIFGPVSADTLFHTKAREGYDVAICMYHDQALIPIKTLDFDHGVNVTLGLPFIRTSPDHGTAHNIAGQGIADATSMIEAVKLAADMAHAHETNKNAN